MFVESFQVEGNPFSNEIPFSFDPRKWVHEPESWAHSKDEASRMVRRIEVIRF
jgi:hypothetical protein